MKSRRTRSKLFKNRNIMIGTCLILPFVLLSIFASILAPHDPTELFQGMLRITPFSNANFMLGTDDLGRDQLSRLIYGSQVSLRIGLSVVFISLLSGTFLGLMAGYFEGIVDSIISKFIELIMSLPSILLAIIVVAILGPGINNAIMAVSVVAIPSFTRIIRAKVLEEKSKEYVSAARSFGASHFRIIFREILPNCLGPLIVQASLGVSDGILNTAALGFLGLGATPPTPEWGAMLSDARHFIESSPHLVFAPGLCILLLVLGFNILGDGLRDFLDPKLR